MHKRKIKILLVDDHPMMLSGLSLRLKQKKFIEIVGTATDGLETIQQAKRFLPDVVLLDISLPKMNGLQALKVLRKDVPQTKVLVYTMHNNAEYVRTCLESGASGYVLKDSPFNEIVAAIHAALDGEIFLCSEITRSPFFSKILFEAKGAFKGNFKTAGTMQAGQPPSSTLIRYSQLTNKEKQILQQIVEGLTMQQIADNLTVSYNTITTHFKHIYKKLQVHTRGAVVAKILREHII